MYIAFEVVQRAIDELRSFHPFFGITFLVCKKLKLPVGRSIHVPINDAEKQFLSEHYKPDYSSQHYFQPLRTSAGRWLSPKYAASGSQSNRTRGDLAAAFDHEKNTDLWGWSLDYIQVLRAKLDRDNSGKIPAFWLATWLFREREWSGTATAQDIIETFLQEYEIVAKEQRELFITTVPDFPPPIFVEEVYSDAELLRHIKAAPDAKPEEGGTLKLLELRGIGPLKQLSFTPGNACLSSPAITVSEKLSCLNALGGVLRGTGLSKWLIRVWMQSGVIRLLHLRFRPIGTYRRRQRFVLIGTHKRGLPRKVGRRYRD